MTVVLAWEVLTVRGWGGIGGSLGMRGSVGFARVWRLSEVSGNLNSHPHALRPGRVVCGDRVQKPPHGRGQAGWEVLITPKED